MANGTNSCSEDETPRVTTLIDLKRRREKLLELKKKKILKQSGPQENTNEVPENLPNINFPAVEKHEDLTEEIIALANCDTTTFSISNPVNLLEIGSDSITTMTLTNNLVSSNLKENVRTDINNVFDFSSDDSVADPNYVPLSEITNLVPFASTSTTVIMTCFLKGIWNLKLHLNLE